MRMLTLVGGARLWLAAALLGSFVGQAEAHPGALDANGCHRVRKTGRKVCHAGHIKPGEHRRFVGFDGVVRHFSH